MKAEQFGQGDVSNKRPNWGSSLSKWWWFIQPLRMHQKSLFPTSLLLQAYLSVHGCFFLDWKELLSGTLSVLWPPESGVTAVSCFLKLLLRNATIPVACVHCPEQVTWRLLKSAAWPYMLFFWGRAHFLWPSWPQGKTLSQVGVPVWACHPWDREGCVCAYKRRGAYFEQECDPCSCGTHA